MARGRPATPLGSYGEINVKELAVGRHQAETRLRLWNGDTVRLQARGKSKTAAVNALKIKCAERLGASDTEVLTTTSPVSALMEHWLETKKKIRPQTRERYRNAIDNHVIPAFGNMRINEVTPAFLNQWLHGKTQGVASNARSVLNGAFSMATRYGLIPANPMAVIEPLAVASKDVRALAVEEIQPFREQIARSKDELLIDVTDFCLATGLRAGEVLALRWEDVDLEHKPPIMRVTGTLTYSKETGHVRQEEGKTTTAGRPIQLPAVALEILERRYQKFGEHLEMVFPSGSGTYVWENNLNRLLREARGERFNWVTIHSLRKTLGSVVADELGPHKAADVLGHADSRLTETVYYQRNRRGVPIGEVVDQVLKVSKKSPDNATGEPEISSEDGMNNSVTSSNRNG